MNNKDNDGCIGCFVFILIMLGLTALSGLGVWLITSSDLPEWFKFWLIFG